MRFTGKARNTMSTQSRRPVGLPNSLSSDHQRIEFAVIPMIRSTKAIAIAP